MEKDQIDEKLIRTKISSLDENFVALGMTVGDIDGTQQGGHSAIFICSGGELKVFHFNNGIVNFTNAVDDPLYEYYFHKELDFIQTDDSTIDAFLALCLVIQKGSNLKFGYVFDGSIYDSITGKHFSDTNMPELATCVGFCINVLSSWIIEEEKYLAIEEWENIAEGHPLFMKYFDYAKKEYPDLTEEKFKCHHRRISPNECTASAYYSIEDITISKNKIDSIISNFSNIVALKSI